MRCLSASDEEATDAEVLVTDDAETEAPHDPNDPNAERDSHDKSVLTNNTISAVAAAEVPSGAANSPTNRHLRLAFFCVMTSVSIGGLGVVSFGVPAGGKVGYPYVWWYETPGLKRTLCAPGGIAAFPVKAPAFAPVCPLSKT